MASQHFPYAVDRRWTPLFALLGVKPHHGVEVTDDGRLIATYGFGRVETTVANVHSAVVSGPHRWYTAVGMRLSFRDSSLTFGTNRHLGLWIRFHEPLPKVIGFRDHATLWVSVEDPSALGRALGLGEVARWSSDDAPPR